MLLEHHRFANDVHSDWIVLCDFDGTISRQDVTDTLLDQFGQPGWEELEVAWERGEIGSRECMARQIALLDASPEELAEAIGRITIDPDFPAFVQAAHALGAPVQILSDGLAPVIRRILAEHGLQHLPVVANQLEQAGPRRWRLSFPNASDHCLKASGTCKCAHAQASRASHPRILYVGDGASDFCVSGTVDFVLAKHRLIDYCRSHGLVHIPIDGFADARAALDAIVHGQLHAIGQPRREPVTVLAAAHNG